MHECLVIFVNAEIVPLLNLRSAFNRLKNAGVHPGLEHMKVLELQVVNTFSLVVIACFFIHKLTSPFSGNLSLSLFSVVGVMGFVYSIWLNDQRRYVFARWNLIFWLDTGISVYAIVLGPQHHLSTVFVFSVLIAVRSFSSRKEHFAVMLYLQYADLN